MQQCTDSKIALKLKCSRVLAKANKLGVQFENKQWTLLWYIPYKRDAFSCVAIYFCQWTKSQARKLSAD